jgi:hypothetical protein
MALRIICIEIVNNPTINVTYLIQLIIKNHFLVLLFSNHEYRYICIKYLLCAKKYHENHVFVGLYQFFKKKSNTRKITVP